MIRYIKDEQHYTLLMDEIAKVKHTLWMLKDLYVKLGNSSKPFLSLLEQKIRKGVSIRLLHAKNRERTSEMILTGILCYGKVWNVPYVHVSILRY